MPQRTTTVRLMSWLLAVGVAVGIFAAGRGTVGERHGGAHRAGQSAGYAQGLADGVRQGRAEQETEALPPPRRDGARAAFDDGYRAGVNDAFAGYDGGWAYATPYVVTLARGGPGITYRIASRARLRPGVDYYLCPHSRGLCQRPRG